MASSLVFLGIGIVLFVVTFGFLVNVAAAVLGTVFSVVGNIVQNTEMTAEWTATFNEIDTTSQQLIVLIMSLGITVIIIKAIMVAASRGNE